MLAKKKKKVDCKIEEIKKYYINSIEATNTINIFTFFITFPF